MTILRKDCATFSKYNDFKARAKDWKIVYSEISEDNNPTYQRELHIKSWKNKKRIKALINENTD